MVVRAWVCSAVAFAIASEFCRGRPFARNGKRAEHCFESTASEEKTHWALGKTRWVLSSPLHTHTNHRLKGTRWVLPPGTRITPKNSLSSRWFTKGWFSKTVVLADVPLKRKPERGYIRMFPQNENRNEGAFACSPGMKTGTRAHSPKAPLTKPAFCLLSKVQQRLIRNFLFQIWWLRFASECSGHVQIYICIRSRVAATAVRSDENFHTSTAIILLGEIRVNVLGWIPTKTFHFVNRRSGLFRKSLGRPRMILGYWKTFSVPKWWGWSQKSDFNIPLAPSCWDGFVLDLWRAMKVPRKWLNRTSQVELMRSRLSFPATEPPDRGTDFCLGSLTHHRPRHLLERFWKFLKGFWRGFEGVLKGFWRGFEGPFGWDRYDDPSKPLQRPVQRPLQKPFRHLLGSGVL